MVKLISLIFCIIFSSCIHNIERIGYTASSVDYSDCTIPVRKTTTFGHSLIKVGEIELGKCKPSQKFTEADAKKLLITEACSVDADTIYIISENDKSEWDKCYRCRAEFYTIKKPNSPSYVSVEMKENTKEANRKYWMTTIGMLALLTAYVVLKINTK